jgi:hypothetical protein
MGKLICTKCGANVLAHYQEETWYEVDGDSDCDGDRVNESIDLVGYECGCGEIADLGSLVKAGVIVNEDYEEEGEEEDDDEEDKDGPIDRPDGGSSR